MSDVRGATIGANRGVSWRLAQRLIAGNGAVVTHEALLFAAYGDDPNGGPASAQGALRVLLCKMKKKFAPGALRCVWGIGYVLDAKAVPEDMRARVDRAEVVMSLDDADIEEFQRTRWRA